LVFLLAGPAASLAAPLPASISDSVQAAKAYDYGMPRQPLRTLEQFAPRAAGDPEQRAALAALMASALAETNTTVAARTFFCQRLAVVGGDAEVPALAQLLENPATADDARIALQAIHGEAAGSALRQALGRLTGRDLVGVIHSLGARRDQAATDALARLLGHADANVGNEAAWSLAMIGTPSSLAAIRQASMEARLLCAARVGGPAAVALYTYLSASSDPAARLAGLAGLAGTRSETAVQALSRAAADGDPLVSAGALQLLAHLEGAEATSALVSQLSAPDFSRQVLVLTALADRGDRAAGDAVTLLAGSSNEMVRAAAADALGKVGDARSVALLARLAAGESGTVRSSAEDALARLAAPGADEAVLQGIAAGHADERTALISAAAARSMSSAVPGLLAASGDADAKVQTAAFKALGRLAGAAEYPQLVEELAAVRNAGLEEAVAETGRRMGDAQARMAPLLVLLNRADLSPDARTAVLRQVARIGGGEALAGVRGGLKSGDAAVRDSAIRALADWKDGAAMEDLLQIAGSAEVPAHRTLALRGLMRLATESGQVIPWLKRTQPLLKNTGDKQQWLSALGAVSDPEALSMAAAALADADVRAEAALAAARIGRSLIKTHPEAVNEAMEKVLAAAPDTAEAAAVWQEAQKTIAAKLAVGKVRREEISKGLSEGARLLAYLDCGTERDTASSGVRLRVLGGRDFKWPGDGGDAYPAGATTAYDGDQVRIEISGLDPQRNYEVGFTWWDYDTRGRAQSVWAGDRKLVDAVALPAWQGKRQAPDRRAIPIPRDLIRDGAVRIDFRKEAADNAVVSELWLIEVPAAAVVPIPVPAPMVKANAGAERRILVVTGLDYPGHKWRETTPVLVDALGLDKRLEISVTDSASFLGSPDLASYHAIVLHYMNWENAGPDAAALENFRKTVEGGTGLVLVHFACGAFQGWPEFVKVAGRVWNPKFRGHDPHGAFLVRIADGEHAVTKGLKDFETVDELYTCLDGTTPMHVLASATSKVDKKDYPMAFALQYGQGRVFHSVLGHDVKALGVPDVGRLFRRGTAWAAGLDPAD
jgi:uncharacterized protein